jgi:cytochrome b561
MVTKYTRIAILLHWAIALGLVIAMAAGLVLDDIDDKAQHAQILNFHRSIGLTLFALTLFRLVWRLTHYPPPAPPMPPAQAILAQGVHILLYGAMIALPISGYLATILRGRDVMFWGLGPLPAILDPDKPAARLFNNIHGAGQYVIYALLIGHVGAALYHQFVLKDRILGRMGLGPAPGHSREQDRDQASP